MILQASKTYVEFNGGDIGVGYGVKDGVGTLAFQDIEIQEIGTKVENSDYLFPVIFKFHKAESIDVIIKALENIKQKMKEGD